MQTKDYTDNLLPLIKGLCGQTFATNELTRINALINRRAKRAYDSSYYWPRFLVIGEERTCTNSVVPDEQSGLQFIDTFLRIHKTQPYYAGSAQDIDFIATADGAQLVAGSLDPSSVYVTYRAQLRDTYGDGTSGTVTTIPEEWFQYIAHGTYADFLRMDGQQDKAALADQEARDILEDELMKISNSRVMDLVAMRTLTNANMQARSGVYYST
jgi:hypothetical protein